MYRKQGRAEHLNKHGSVLERKTAVARSFTGVFSIFLESTARLALCGRVAGTSVDLRTSLYSLIFATTNTRKLIKQIIHESRLHSFDE